MINTYILNIGNDICDLVVDDNTGIHGIAFKLIRRNDKHLLAWGDTREGLVNSLPDNIDKTQSCFAVMDAMRLM